jgi:predicted MPP superfamily phosphohydrolase
VIAARTARARLHRRVRPPRSLGLFATVVASVFALVHLAIWWRLVGGAGVEGLARPLVSGMLASLYLAVPLAFASRYLGGRVPEWVGRLGFTWIGLVFYWFALSVLAEPVVQAANFLVPGVPWGAAAAGLVTAVGGAFSLAALRGAGLPGVVRVEVPVVGLDPRLDGMKLALLSDVHVGPTVDRAFVQGVVDRVNAEEADLVAITGDLVDGGVSQLASAVAPLGTLRSRHGTFFVTGNHEYYAGAEAWCAHLEGLGIRVLRNERERLDHDGAPIDVAGIDDPFASAPGHGPDLPRALAGRDPSHPVVLLAHQPVAAEEAARHGVTLQLSGHTHGGQLWPFVHLVKLVQPFVAGLHRVHDTWVYVSRGTAWWGPPMRLGAPNEISVLTLRRASTPGPA